MRGTIIRIIIVDDEIQAISNQESLLSQKAKPITLAITAGKMTI